MHSNRTIAFIPARGGSKRLPGKNTKLFNGKPLLYYTINYAKKTKLFDRIFVSTDNKEIAKLAVKYGAEVVNRPPAISTDLSSTTSAAVHLMETLEKEKYIFDVVATLQVTNPLRNKKLLSSSLDIFTKSKADSALTVSLNTHKLGEIKNNLFKAKTYNPGDRSQDLKESYFENGLLYLTHYKTLKKQKSLYGKKILPLIIQKASREQIPTFLSLSSLNLFFIKPSFSKKASSPTKLAEVLSMGIPVITNSGVGDVDAIINEHKCGIVLPKFTAKEFEIANSSIDDLLQKPSADIRKVAVDYFSLKIGADRYDSVYKKMLNTH